jgi:spermidine synthase
MKPRYRLAETRTPDGGLLVLHMHDNQFRIMLDGRELMHSYTTHSEAEMGTQVSRRLGGRAAPRYLIGGLGLGFTLRAVLDQLPPAGGVDVAELLPAVVEWNRTYMRELNGALLDDPRVSVHLGDVVDLLRDGPPSRYDAILLDVDNGPAAFVVEGNDMLYEDVGFDLLKRALRPRGQLAFWSGWRDDAFYRRLRRAGFRVDAVPTKSYPSARRVDYVIYYADRPY